MKGSSVVEILVAMAIFSTALLGAGFMTLQSFKFAHQGLLLTQKILQQPFHETNPV